MGLKETINEFIPPAFYPDGREAQCPWYKVFSLLSIDADAKDKKSS